MHTLDPWKCAQVFFPPKPLNPTTRHTSQRLLGHRCRQFSQRSRAHQGNAVKLSSTWKGNILHFVKIAEWFRDYYSVPYFTRRSCLMSEVWPLLVSCDLKRKNCSRIHDCNPFVLLVFPVLIAQSRLFSMGRMKRRKRKHSIRNTRCRKRKRSARCRPSSPQSKWTECSPACSQPAN